MFFSIFIRDLNTGIKRMLSKSAGETRFENIADESEDTVMVQKVLSRFAHWAFLFSSKMQFKI